MKNVKKLILVAVTMVFVLSFSACKKDEAFVIKVGNEKITESALNDKLSVASANFQEFAKTPLGKKQFIEFVVQRCIIIAEAKKAGTENKEEFKKFLEEQQKLFASHKDAKLVEMYLKDIGEHENMKVSDSEIQSYYNDHKSEYESQEVYTIRHILVPNKETAQKVYERIKKGEKFERVAREMSTDPTAQDGGLIGPVPVKKGSLIPSKLEEVALKLKKGKISEVVETPHGCHIILKVSEEKLSVTLDDAKERIRKILGETKLDEWFKSKRETLGVEVKDDVMISKNEQQR